jgi:hypothetical protein
MVADKPGIQELNKDNLHYLKIESIRKKSMEPVCRFTRRKKAGQWRALSVF